MFYRPKHMKRNPNSFVNCTRRAVKFIVDETIWYIKWLGNFPKNTYRYVKTWYKECIDAIVNVIDKFDGFVDSFA